MSSVAAVAPAPAAAAAEPRRLRLEKPVMRAPAALPSAFPSWMASAAVGCTIGGADEVADGMSKVANGLMRKDRMEAMDADDDALLPGELPSSRDPEDAVHWVAVYTELTDTLLRHPDAESFHPTLERYRQRQAFWRLRLNEVSGGRPELTESSGSAP
jgi:hypothetical protein